MRVPGGLILTSLLLAAGCGGSTVAGTPDAGGTAGSGASSAGGSGGNVTAGAGGAGASSASGGSSQGAGGTATAGAGGVAGVAGAGGAGGTIGTGGTIGGPGYCTDPADLAAYKASYPIGNGATGSIQDVAQACSLDCLSDANPQLCALACIQQRTNHAFSTDCTQCFVDSMVCQLTHCVTECLNPGATCNACLCANGCVAKTVQCTGIPDNTCSGG